MAESRVTLIFVSGEVGPLIPSANPPNRKVSSGNLDLPFFKISPF